MTADTEPLLRMSPSDNKDIIAHVCKIPGLLYGKDCILLELPRPLVGSCIGGQLHQIETRFHPGRVCWDKLRLIDSCYPFQDRGLE